MTIKEARTKAGMTHEEVSEHFGVPVRSLENWECGFRKPPVYVEKWLTDLLLQEANKATVCVIGNHITVQCGSELKTFTVVNDMIPIAFYEYFKDLIQAGYHIEFCY